MAADDRAPDTDDTYEGGEDHLAENLAAIDDELADQRAAALRVGLEDYDLDEDDAELLEGLVRGEDGIEYMPALPVVAIVGRPNVGDVSTVLYEP